MVWYTAGIGWVYCGNAVAVCVQPHCTSGAGQRTKLGHQTGVIKVLYCRVLPGNSLVSDHS